MTNNAFAIRAGSCISLEYAWWLLLGIDFSQFVGGSANPYMPLKSFGHHLALRPGAPVLSAFEERAGLVRQRIVANDNESKALAAIRDALLPRLISGELRVEHAERFVGARG